LEERDVKKKSQYTQQYLTKERYRLPEVRLPVEEAAKGMPLGWS
jgi:hypothetical protein